jgi:sulfate/thiosulfate-binding protein
MHRVVIVMSVFTILAAILAATALSITSTGTRAAQTKLNIVGYAVPGEAFGQIIKLWQRTPDGRGVTFSESWGPSTAQARAVAAGQKADIVHLSTGLDVEEIVKAGRIDPKWNRQGLKGIATHSVVVFAVRDGNPKKIRRWQDLVRPGVTIVTPNPGTSGAAKWNVLAAYGAARALGKKEKQAIAFVDQLFRNVVSLDSSGRTATNSFLAGRGDVFLTYENEALLARRNGENIQYVIPRQTMLIEAPIAVLKDSENKDLATKFVQFTRTSAAQRILGEYGFRPMLPAVAKELAKKYPSRPTIFKIDDNLFGGWQAADKKWFDPDTGLMTSILRNVGANAG